MSEHDPTGYDPKPPDKWHLRGLRAWDKAHAIAHPILKVEVEVNGVILEPEEVERILDD